MRSSWRTRGSPPGTRWRAARLAQPRSSGCSTATPRVLTSARPAAKDDGANTRKHKGRSCIQAEIFGHAEPVV